MIWALHRRALSGEIMQGERDPFQPREGPVRWLQWKIWPWRDSEGRIGGIFVSTEDVTMQVETERALRESEERFRTIVGMAPTASSSLTSKV